MISVVIPTYNHAGYVLECVNSVLNQSVNCPVEVIVINDGSPDRTAELLAPLHELGQIRLVSQTNQGQSAARNRGLAEAQGEFVAFLDDDDVWPVDKLEWQLAAMQSDHDSVVVYGYAEICRGMHTFRQPAGQGPSGRVFDAIASGAPMRSPGQALIRASALRTVGGFDSNIWGVDDWDLFLRLAKVGGFKYVDRLALVYREHDGNASLKFSRMFENAVLVRDKHFLAIEHRALFLRADKAIREFTTWDGSRAFDIYVKNRQLLKAMACMVELVAIRHIGFRQLLRMCTKLSMATFR